MKFVELITEGKNYPTLYHFTDFQTAWVILTDMQLEAGGEGAIYIGGAPIPYERNYVSLTRNARLNWGDTRIAIDGAKLSNKYKIQPYADVRTGVTKHTGQWEERIVAKKVNIKGTVLQVDIAEGFIKKHDPFQYEDLYRVSNCWDEVLSTKDCFIKAMKKKGIKRVNFLPIEDFSKSRPVK